MFTERSPQAWSPARTKKALLCCCLLYKLIALATLGFELSESPNSDLLPRPVDSSVLSSHKEVILKSVSASLERILQVMVRGTLRCGLAELVD